MKQAAPLHIRCTNYQKAIRDIRKRIIELAKIMGEDDDLFQFQAEVIEAERQLLSTDQRIEGELKWDKVHLVKANPDDEDSEEWYEDEYGTKYEDLDIFTWVPP